MCRIRYSTKRAQIKIFKVDLENAILKYDVIDDAFKVICNNNLKRSREFGDIRYIGDMGTGMISPINR